MGLEGFDRGTGRRGWRIHAKSNEGYQDEGRVELTPDEAIAIARVIDSMKGTNFTKVIQAANDAAASMLRERVKSLEEAVGRLDQARSELDAFRQ
jgi:hypothetical protein